MSYLNPTPYWYATEELCIVSLHPGIDGVQLVITNTDTAARTRCVIPANEFAQLVEAGVEISKHLKAVTS